MRGWLQGIWQWLTGSGEIVSEDLWQVAMNQPQTVGAIKELIAAMVPQHFRAADYPRYQEWLSRQSDTVEFTPFAIFND